MTPGGLRALLAITGGLAGLAYWLILDEGALRDFSFSLQLFTTYFLVAAFPAFGLIAGPIAPPRAAGLALAIGGISAALVTWAGFRFDQDATTALEPTGEGLFIGPFLALASLLIPFAIAWSKDRTRWFDYQILFDTAWSAVVKSAITLLFVGLFWAIYFLCNTLLELVGIDILEDLTREDWAWPMITGIVTGLSLAVTCELDSVILTLRGLILRLLRLLVIPVALVVSVFLVAVIAQGLEDVFRGFSAAATMMLITAGSVTLIAAVLGHDDADASTNTILILSARFLSLLLPIVAAIAVVAIWQRVAQYGWTPSRIAAFVVALIVVAYALPPALFAIRAREGWMERIRTGFVVVVIGIIALSALWFTPILNAQRIAAGDQVERFLAERIDLDDYNFWPLVREWGRAGHQAAEDLEAATGLADHARIKEQIALVRAAEFRWDAERGVRNETALDQWKRIVPDIPLFPAGAQPLPRDLSEAAVNSTRLNFLYDACTTFGEAGERRCAAIAGDFLPGADGTEYMMIGQRLPSQSPTTVLLYRDADGIWRTQWVRMAGNTYSGDQIDAIRGARYRVDAPSFRSLFINGYEFLPQP